MPVRFWLTVPTNVARFGTIFEGSDRDRGEVEADDASSRSHVSRRCRDRPGRLGPKDGFHECPEGYKPPYMRAQFLAKAGH
ncbi:uncharacterized protein L969DRAFT_63225 [Mixia osmundae IAM 14324]|uniref:Uncharacterized protein n=1 Tax=Mixia osmundae (strain CBS 9802 / IAM 14324 / JCM 22182 / KY 12970) TaxID=764103 RepID=G7E7E5_MIXOS|nr:uncharacterized protein L969DRAFT_63225 [Mixia osmundae IAM 14324]KEI38914.1 hypothetical protein L969DRAFT_63225 [Mixia osmundae IAM 14324]GAA98755.1 hypothetical protein E5Q_05443 [Mixia osmundae IAM 14324]